MAAPKVVWKKQTGSVTYFGQTYEFNAVYRYPGSNIYNTETPQFVRLTPESYQKWKEFNENDSKYGGGAKSQYLKIEDKAWDSGKSVGVSDYKTGINLATQLINGFGKLNSKFYKSYAGPMTQAQAKIRLCGDCKPDPITGKIKGVDNRILKTVHATGRAFDISTVMGDAQPAGALFNNNDEQTLNSLSYQLWIYMRNNASSYGHGNISNEWWHWEYIQPVIDEQTGKSANNTNKGGKSNSNNSTNSNGGNDTSSNSTQEKKKTPGNSGKTKDEIIEENKQQLAKLEPQDVTEYNTSVRDSKMSPVSDKYEATQIDVAKVKLDKQLIKMKQ